MAVAIQETEVVQLRIAKQVYEAFQEAARRRGVELDVTWEEVAEAWAGLDESESEKVGLWLELGRGLCEGPPDMADRHDHYAYGRER